MRWLLLLLLGFSGPVWTQKPPSSAQKDRFIKFVRLASWTQKENMVDLVRPAIALRPANIPADTLPTGVSRYGGRPDLPPDWAWPEFEGRPMAFLGQFDLGLAAGLAPDTLWPARGWLYFFAWFPQPSASGKFPIRKKPAEYRVLWFDGSRGMLRPRDYPDRLPPDLRFQPAYLQPATAFGLPGWNDWRIERLGLPERDLNRLADFSGVYGVEEDHLFGYAYPLRSHPGWDWSAAYLGLDPDSLSPVQRQELQYLRADFVHLLSFELNPTFPSLGTARAYWGIRRQDLVRKDFSKVMLVLQDM
jgi:hypothetical protein